VRRGTSATGPGPVARWQPPAGCDHDVAVASVGPSQAHAVDGVERGSRSHARGHHVRSPGSADVAGGRRRSRLAKTAWALQEGTDRDLAMLLDEAVQVSVSPICEPLRLRWPALYCTGTRALLHYGTQLVFLWAFLYAETLSPFRPDFLGQDGHFNSQHMSGH